KGSKRVKDLSSASPAHTPKEEYAITQTAPAPKEETLHDQPEGQRERQDDKLCPSLGLEGPEEEKSWEEHQEQLEKEMQEARRMVFHLQALLLHGSLPEEDQDGSVSLGDTRPGVEQQLVLLRSRLDQSTEETLDLKRELLRHKQEARHLQAIKDALQRRLAVQEDAVLQLKQELLRCNMAKDQLEGENEELKHKLSEGNKLITEYEQQQQLGRKDRVLQQQQQKLEEAQQRAQEGGFGRVDERGIRQPEMFAGETSVLLHNGTETKRQGLKIAATDTPLLNAAGLQGEELQLVREALRSLRDNFSGHDPQHHTLDTLEQGVSSLVDRLHSLESQRRQDRGVEFKSPGRRANSTDRDSWPPSSKMAHSHSSPGLDTAVSTKVLYFTDRSLTPFLITIPKRRLGEVTLRDFKAAVDRQGNFRYHFKALDPEFGTVKEEVFQDSAVVPGWEGKIVAWVEEDHGER
uniref:DIX domain containing 1a n=1 Tax=Tetraodon nigroviridis TaxID=99883 RepID=H3DFI9_TETNG